MMKFKLNPICKSCNQSTQYDDVFVCHKINASFIIEDPSWTTCNHTSWAQPELKQHCPNYKKLLLLGKVHNI